MAELAEVLVTVTLDGLAPLTSRAFEAALPDGTREAGLVVRGPDGVCRAFANRCPHVPRYALDFGDGEVVDARDGRVVCANHGARFDPVSGVCTSGPCLGRSLLAWPCDESAGVAQVRVGPVPQDWPAGRG
jgi:nitrite reductase/ring-hydroxylating ferredoxin subunit